MRKKILLLVATLMLGTAFLTGCNKQVVDWNLVFNRAYVKVGNEWIDIEVKTWTDYDGEQLQLTLKDGTVMVVSSVNCILYNGNLPKID